MQVLSSSRSPSVVSQLCSGEPCPTSAAAAAPCDEPRAHTSEPGDLSVQGPGARGLAQIQGVFPDGQGGIGCGINRTEGWYCPET